ncbi:MAG: AraC family transcriptional regulator [Spirochaetota bacterium]
MKYRADTSDHFYRTARSNASRMLVPRFIHIGKMRHRSAWSYPAHMHRCNECFLAIEGSALVSIDGEEYPVNAGGMYFVMTGQTHAERSIRTPLSFHYMKFDSRGVSGSGEPLVSGLPVKKQFIPSTPAKIAELFACIAKEAQEDKPGAKDIIDAEILALIWHIRRAVKAIDSTEGTMRQLAIVEAAREYAAENRSRTIRLDEIADACAVSPDYLGHLFKEHVGASPLKYAMSVRIEEAKRLIGVSGLSVSEAAHALGFSSVFHLSRKFKQYAQCSPTVWAGRAQQKSRKR